MKKSVSIFTTTVFFLLLHFLAVAQPDSSATTTASNKARLVVSFNSICCGIDKVLHKQFLETLEKYPKKVEHNMYRWGREGEMDYCFTLQELSKKDQKKFIRKIKKTIKGSRMVTIQQNINCPR
ncbi:MAG: hypothetical protein J0M08_05715 [Bacteroidetes bacterium]|nr:hypothetical protein [Bacteroidota bacterium]